jgi:hypothetical protein
MIGRFCPPFDKLRVTAVTTIYEGIQNVSYGERGGR